MNILTYITLYGVSIPIFVVLDMIWLLLIAQGFYQKRIGHLMEINIAPAVLFYALFLLGLVIFAIYPAYESGGWQRALMLGALFGFFTYMTYDLTNLATLRDWPIDMVIIDIIWGTALGGLVAALTLYIHSLFG